MALATVGGTAATAAVLLGSGKFTEEINSCADNDCCRDQGIKRAHDIFSLEKPLLLT